MEAIYEEEAEEGGAKEYNDDVGNDYVDAQYYNSPVAGVEEYCGAFRELTTPLETATGQAEGVKQEINKENRPNKNHLLVSFWRRPVTKVYLDNFGFGVNGYQPMIDFLDDRDSGRSDFTGLVHLPYLEERCMNQYSARKPFKLYSNYDIDYLIDKGEKIRTRIRQNDAAGASNVLRRTHTNWSMTKKYVQLVKKSFVVDFRKSHSNGEKPNKSNIATGLGNLGIAPVEPPRYQREATPNLDIVFVPRNRHSARYLNLLTDSDMDGKSTMGSYILDKMDHDRGMSERRQRLADVDDIYEESVTKLAATIEKMNKRAKTVNRVVTPQGNIYSVGEVQLVTDEVLAANRHRRRLDMDRLSDSVDAAATYRYRPRDGVSGVNAMTLALARRNAIESEISIDAANAWRAEHNFYGSSDRAIDEKIDDLKYQSRKLGIVDVEAIDMPRRRRVLIEDDVISSVQIRVMKRAREIGGNTSENRRITNRAKFVNTTSGGRMTGDASEFLAPSKVERNISYMATTMAFGSGTARRKFDVDEEMDEPRPCLSSNMIKTYCTREFDKPVPKYSSDSLGVRQAVSRARFRNALLGQ